MGHLISPTAELMLDVPVKVLDKGMVRLVDYMGTDDRIVQAARVSYGSGTKTKREDAKLVQYLVKNRHDSPTEKVVFEFHVKLPIFVARQWIRHRTGSFNEVSARYSQLPEDFYVPKPENVAGQDTVNKQGREGDLSPARVLEFLNAIETSSHDAYRRYQQHLSNGVARELARMFLPVNFYTEWYWTVNLRNLLHFLNLRLDSHAQWEIRQYAQAILPVAAAVAPNCVEAWVRHWSDPELLAGCHQA